MRSPSTSRPSPTRTGCSARSATWDAGAGLAINPGTPVEHVAELAAQLDYVNVLAVNPGFAGQSFIATTPGRIARLRALLPEPVVIEVDGGIGVATLPGRPRGGRDACSCPRRRSSARPIRWPPTPSWPRWRRGERGGAAGVRDRAGGPDARRRPGAQRPRPGEPQPAGGRRGPARRADRGRGMARGARDCPTRRRWPSRRPATTPAGRPWSARSSPARTSAARRPAPTRWSRPAWRAS